MSLVRLLAMATLGVTLTAGMSSAWALDAPLAADSHVAAGLPTINFGALPSVIIGGGSTGLLRFDLSTLPAGTSATKLVKATLVLFASRVGTPGAIELQTVNGAWAEATVTGATLPPTSGAGSFAPVTVSAANQFVAIDVTAQVRQWITSPGSNFGVAIAPAITAPGTVVFLDSKENTLSAQVARLDLTLADQGQKGDPGPKGDTGPRGQTGAKGDTGSPGLPGVKGDTGATGAKGDTGAAGPKGDTGAAGPKGDSGASGVLAMTPWSGGVATVAPTNQAYLFIGPVALVTTTATQRVTASGTLTLVPATTAGFRFDICFAPSSGGGSPASPGNGFKFVHAAAPNERTLLAATNSFVPGAGTWRIGPCARSEGAVITLFGDGGNTDWSTGWAMVSNDGPAATAAQASTVNRSPVRP